MLASLQINLGLLADEDRRPVAVRGYPGNTADPSTVQDQVRKLKDEFGLDLVLFVGDRGMATQTQIDKLIEQGGVERSAPRFSPTTETELGSAK